MKAISIQTKIEQKAMIWHHALEAIEDAMSTMALDFAQSKGYKNELILSGIKAMFITMLEPKKTLYLKNVDTLNWKFVKYNTHTNTPVDIISAMFGAVEPKIKNAEESKKLVETLYNKEINNVIEFSGSNWFQNRYGYNFIQSEPMMIDYLEEVANKIGPQPSMLPPMVVKPKEWERSLATNEWEGGTYLSSQPYIKLGGRIQTDRRIFEFLDAMQNEKLLFNFDRIKDFIEEENKRIRDIKECRVDEAGKELKSYNQIEIAARTLEIKKIDFYKRAKLIKINKGEFYQTWKFDTRGRVYPNAYNINSQGADHERAGITFENPMRRGIEQKFDASNRVHYWLAINIANYMGLDKLKFEERIEWVVANIENLKYFADDADDKAQYLQAVDGLLNELSGKPDGTIVYLDATNQALQLYSVLLRDKKTAKLCNVVGSDIADAYASLAGELNKVYMNEELLEKYPNGIFDRKVCKKTVMTALYNKVNQAEEILNGWNTHYPERPSLLMEIDTDIDKLDEAIKRILYKLMPSAMYSMSIVQQAHESVIAENYDWTLPDGFRARAQSIYRLKDPIKFNIIYSPTGETREYNLVFSRKWYGKDRNYRGLSANIIHSVDGYILRNVKRKLTSMGIPLIAIHDAYGTLPQYCDILREEYRSELMKLLTSNLLEELIFQATGQRVQLPKGDLTINDIKSARYFLM